MTADSKRYYAELIGSGSYVPPSTLSNFDLEKTVNTSDEWITTRTGIQERHIAAKDQATSDLASQAALLALQNSHKHVNDIDMIIVATVTADMPFPSTACFVQKKIGAINACAFDISAACSGFVYGISMAKAFIESGQKKTILLIGAEVLSKFVDWTDRQTCVLFGDAAGAVVLSRTHEKRGIIYSELSSDSKYTDLLYLPGGGSLFPPNLDTFKEKKHTIKMQGNDVFKIAVQTMVESVQNTLKKNDLSIHDISCLIAHQANIRILSAVAKRLSCPKDKLFINVNKYGNTSAATIPLALDEYLKDPKNEKKDLLVLCVAFGAGFTSGSFLINIQNK